MSLRCSPYSSAVAATLLQPRPSPQRRPGPLFAPLRQPDPAASKIIPAISRKTETGSRPGRGDGGARRKNRRVDGGVTCVSKSVTNSKGDAPLIEGEGRLR